MALFNRFFGSQSSQSSQSSASVRRKGSEPSVWRQYYEAVPEPCDVRVVVFRQCERKGQKLLFDSSTVTRERLAGPGDVERPELYKEQSEGWGYRYLKAASDVRQLHDMIFGGAGVAHQDINMKLHQLDSGLMWSSVLQPPHPGRQPGQHQASDNSLGSSFGCSIGSFSRTDSSHGNDVISLSCLSLLVPIRDVQWSDGPGVEPPHLGQWLLLPLLPILPLLPLQLPQPRHGHRPGQPDQAETLLPR